MLEPYETETRERQERIADAEMPDDLCSLEVLFNGKQETILEITRSEIPRIAANPKYKIVGKPKVLGYGAAKDRFCEEFGTEG